MKVKTLIKKLQGYNPEAEVRLNSSDGDVALFVNQYTDNNEMIWLDGEHDMDLGEEIAARIERAVEEQIDELDFYMDLLEIGITVDMVREYLGEEPAIHMQEFCKEHGLI